MFRGLGGLGYLILREVRWRDEMVLIVELPFPVITSFLRAVT